MGTYTLRQEFSFAAQDANSIQLLPSVSLDEIGSKREVMTHTQTTINDQLDQEEDYSDASIMEPDRQAVYMYMCI